MKIVHIVPSLNMGGAEKLAVDLCNELSVENEIHLCVLDRIDDSMILIEQVDTKVNFHSMNKTKGYSFTTMWKLFVWLKKLQPDVIHTHLRALVYSSLYILFSRTPIVHTVHNLAHKETGGRVRRLYSLLFNRFNVTPVSISHMVQKSVQEVYGNSHSQLVYNGVRALEKSPAFSGVQQEVEGYKTDRNTKVLLSVGRIGEQKNYLMMIDVVKELNESGANLLLLLIGSTTNEPQYASKCLKASKSAENIHFLGEKSNVGDYMHIADAFCLSSSYEGLPLVILEAMSVGVPILSTPAGGIPDVVENGVNGFICEGFTKEDYRPLLKKIDDLTPEYRSESMRKYEQNYSMHICMTNYLNLYVKLQKSGKSQ